MGHRWTWVVAIVIGGAVFLSGCIEKTVLPAVLVTVAKVEPYDLIPTATETSALPTVDVTLDFESAVPTNLRSYSITYRTRAGQALPELTVPETPYQIKFSPTAGQVVTLRPYTSRVVDLYELTPSAISPIVATIRLTLEDVNGNTVFREATCRLFKPQVSGGSGPTPP